jgi:hypothetical protein
MRILALAILVIGTVSIGRLSIFGNELQFTTALAS